MLPIWCFSTQLISQNLYSVGKLPAFVDWSELFPACGPFSFSLALQRGMFRFQTNLSLYIQKALAALISKYIIYFHFSYVDFASPVSVDIKSHKL